MLNNKIENAKKVWKNHKVECIYAGGILAVLCASPVTAMASSTGLGSLMDPSKEVLNFVENDVAYTLLAGGAAKFGWQKVTEQQDQGFKMVSSLLIGGVACTKAEVIASIFGITLGCIFM